MGGTPCIREGWGAQVYSIFKENSEPLPSPYTGRLVYIGFLSMHTWSADVSPVWEAVTVNLAGIGFSSDTVQSPRQQ